MIHKLSFLSRLERINLLKIVKNEQDLLKLNTKDLSYIINRKINSKIFEDKDKFLKECHIALNAIEFYNIKILILGLKEYPYLLSEIYDPPYCLFLRGKAPLNYDFSIAILGTRNCSAYAASIAQNLGEECYLLDIPLFSGLAEGVDINSQVGYLNAGGENTFAIIATGLDKINSSAKNVASKIVEKGGGILSETLPNERIFKHHFLKRNRIITGICNATLIIEAPKKSGALSSARHALEQGRDVFIHSLYKQNPNSEGTFLLANDGAIAIDSIKELKDQYNRR